MLEPSELNFGAGYLLAGKPCIVGRELSRRGSEEGPAFQINV